MCPAKHVVLQHLQPVDVAFDGAVAPGHRHPGVDRRIVVTQALRKTPQGCPSMTTGSGTCQSAATSAPSTIVSPQVSQAADPGGTSISPIVMPASHDPGSVNNTQRPHCASRSPARTVSA